MPNPMLELYNVAMGGKRFLKDLNSYENLYVSFKLKAGTLSIELANCSNSANRMRSLTPTIDGVLCSTSQIVSRPPQHPVLFRPRNSWDSFGPERESGISKLSPE